MEIRSRIASATDYTRVKKLVMSSILESFPDLPDDDKQNAEVVVGEQLANITKHGTANEEVIVSARVSGGFFCLTIDSESIRENWDKLSLLLGHAQECVNRGIGCDFFSNGHGLGHYLIARCSTESCYEDGTFKAKFDLNAEDSKKKSGVLVDLAFA